MELLILLGRAAAVLVGYAAGAVALAPRRRVFPAGWDLCALVLLAAAAVLEPKALPSAAMIGAALAAAFAAGAISTFLRRADRPLAPDPSGTPGSCARRCVAAARQFAAGLGDYQSRVLLAAFHFAMVLPLAPFVRRLRDPLGARARTGAWRERAALAESLESLREQS